MRNIILTKTRARPAHRKSSFNPQVETLDNRWCPSCLVSTLDGGATLRIEGDKHANVVAIKQDDGASDLEVKCDGVKKNFDSSVITKIVVDLKGGKDQFTFNVAEDTFKYAKTIQVHLGQGNDQALFDTSSDANAPGKFSTIKADLNVQVFGNQGNDVVKADFGSVDSANVSFLAQLGQGRDKFFGRFLGDLKGTAHVGLDVRGGSDNDQVSVLAKDDLPNALPGIDIDAGASLAVNLKGGAGTDVASFTYDGVLDGHLNLTNDGNGGKDKVSADITLEAGSDGFLDAAVRGRQDNDKLTFLLTDNSAGTAHITQALLDGGPGHDTCVATPNVTVKHCP